MKDQELRYSGSVPASYDRLMVPLLFRPYAEELARRARKFRPRRILETAAGTGAATETLHEALPNVEIVATDLSQSMLDVVAERLKSDTVSYVAADALELPFPDRSFDLVVCQFGAMFFPDRVKGHSEAWRVLDHDGHYLLAIWDNIERNPLSDTSQQTLIDLFPKNPPLFMRDGPHSYHDPAAIRRDLRAAGFAEIEIETVELRSRSPSAHDAATALCHGTPMGVEIQDREPGAIERAFETIKMRFALFDGANGIDAPMSAHIVSAVK